MSTIHINRFSGGMNTRDAPHMLADDESVLIQNFEISEDGSIKKRRGSSKYNASAISANPVHSVYRFYKSATAYKKLIVGCGSTLYVGDDALGTFSSIGSLSTSDVCSFLTWGDILYIANGTVFKTYDGTAYANVSGSPPIGKYIAFHKDRIFVAGISSVPNRVSFCDTGDPATWTPGSNFVDIKSNDGDEITGIAPIGENLVIYKNNSIWLLHGNSNANFFLTQVVHRVGCRAPRTVVTFQGVHFFLHRDGVYVFSGAEVQKISAKIDPDIAAIPIADFSDASAVLYGEKYLLSVSDGSSRRILVFDVRNGFSGWVVFEGLPVNSFIVWDSRDDEGELYAGDFSNGFVWRLDIGNADGGADITAKLVSKNFNFDDVVRYKKVLITHLQVTRAVSFPDIKLIGDYGEQSSLETFDVSEFVAVFDSFVFGKDAFSAPGIALYRKSVRTLVSREVSIELSEISSVAISFFGIGFTFAPMPEEYGVLDG